MKYLLTFLLFVSFSCFAQEPAYTPMRLNYQFRGIKVDSLFLVPSFNDTTSANNSTMKNVAGSMIRTGNDFWMRNAATTAWLQNVNVGSGASPAIQFVDSIYRVAGKDSIFWRKGGVVSKIKDSILGQIGIDTVLAVVDSLKSNRSININNKRFTTKNGNKIFGLDINKTLSNNYVRLDNRDSLLGGTITLDDSGIAIQPSSGFSDLFLFNNLVNCSPGIGGFVLDNTGGYYGSNKDAVNKIRSKYDIITGDYILYDSIESVSNFEYIKVNRINKFMILSADSIKLDAPEIKINTTSRVKLGDLSTTDTKGDILANHSIKNMDLSSGNISLNFPGVYSISTASASNKLSFPAASDFPGQMIIVINKANATTQNIDGGVDTDGNDLDVTADSIGTYYSDSEFWYGYIN